MNKFLIGLLSFAAGCGITYFVTDKVIEQKYEKISCEEIESVKEAFLKKYAKKENKKMEIKEEDYTLDEKTENLLSELDELDESDIDNSTAISYNEEPTSEEEKINYSELIKKMNAKFPTNKDTGMKILNPEVDIFGNDGEFDTVFLTYYAGNGVLADDSDSIIDIRKTIGEDALNHFGDYEEDIVQVRNELMKTDYEVNLDKNSFDESSES